MERIIDINEILLTLDLRTEYYRDCSGVNISAYGLGHLATVDELGTEWDGRIEEKEETLALEAGLTEAEVGQMLRDLVAQLEDEFKNAA